MSLIRWILGRLILAIDFITSPRSIRRPASQQQQIDIQTENLALYQYKACPFCVKVRRFMKRHALNIETRDAKREADKRELSSQGGKIQVPCLRIENEQGEVTWLYESSAIVAYLEEQFLLVEPSPQEA